MEPTYTVNRLFANGAREELVVNLTLEEARAFCSDAESSSRTCTLQYLIELTRVKGPWFNGYTEE